MFRLLSNIFKYFDFTIFSFQIFEVKKYFKILLNYLEFVSVGYSTTVDMKRIVMKEEVYD